MACIIIITPENLTIIQISKGTLNDANFKLLQTTFDIQITEVLIHYRNTWSLHC